MCILIVQNTPQRAGVHVLNGWQTYMVVCVYMYQIGNHYNIIIVTSHKHIQRVKPTQFQAMDTIYLRKEIAIKVNSGGMPLLPVTVDMPRKTHV